MSRNTLSQSISQALAADIVSGKLPAGARLDELSLAERFEVSRSPVRDALRQLAATRLVEYQPRRGFSVASVDPESLRDLYEGLAEIEVICAGLCAMRAGMIERTRIRQLFAACKTAAESGDPDAYVTANDNFHLAVYAGSHNSTLESIAIELRQRLAPLRTHRFFMKSRVDNSITEHEELLAALMRQDKTAAMAAMRVHASHTAVNVLDRIFGEQEADLEPPTLHTTDGRG